MESFMKAADDLDKLLDEFEKNEDLGSNSKLTVKPVRQPIQNGFSPSLQNGTDQKLPDQHGLEDNNRYDSDLLIDLSEADFAPAPQSSSLLASLTPGVLQPTKTGSSEDLSKGDDRLSSLRSDSNKQLGSRDFSSYLENDLETTVNTLNELKDLDFQGDQVTPKAQQEEQIKISNVPKLANGIRSDGHAPSPAVSVTSPEFGDTALRGGSSTFSAPELADKFTVTPSEIQEIQTENTKRASPIGSPVVGKEVVADANLMKTYLKQGARPKVPGVVKTPDSDEDPKGSSQPSEDLAVTDVQSLTNSETPSVVNPESKPVGFGNTSDISVSQDELEALEAELKQSGTTGNLPSMSSSTESQAHPATGGQNTADDQRVGQTVGDRVDSSDQDRVSPLSKLLSQQAGTAVVSRGTNREAVDNELANLDPFFQDSQDVLPEDDRGPASPPAPLNQLDDPVVQTQGSSTESGTRESGNSSTVAVGEREIPHIASQEVSHSQPPRQGGQPTVNGGGGVYVPVQDPFAIGQMPNGVQPEVAVPESEQHNIVPASQIDDEVRPLNGEVEQPSSSAVTPPNAQMGPNFVLPPDPPSYQQVQEWKAAEFERIQVVSRDGLTLDFNQPAQRRVGLQHLPPSPIMEEVGVTTGYVRDSPHHPGRRRQRGEQPRAVPNEQSQNVSSTNNGSAGTTTEPTQNGVAEREGAIQEPDNLTVEVGGVPVRLGDVAPVWIPDTEAASCMQCGSKFTFRKRRHHCRACGKVFCATCCNVRVKLKYMKTREARVCATCLNAILTAEAMQRVSDAIQSNENSPENNGTENTTGGQPQEDMTEEDSSHAPVQRSRSVLRQPSNDGSHRPRESRRVRFSDGIPAGSDRGEPDGSNVSNTESRVERSSRRRLSRQRGSKSFIPESEGVLPPRLLPLPSGDFRTVENPKVDEVMAEIKNEAADPVIFLLSKVLQVHVKIVHLNCCVNRICWCFTTKGLAAVGQDEIVFVLECLPEERGVPRDMLLHIYKLYQSAVKGNTVQNLGHCVFTHSFLDSREHAGFLYLSPTYQCQQKLILPEQPYLYGILLQKWELPWAKIFPLRLMLRLGAEFRYYPCPLMSVRFRKPVFQEIGHTIMNLLADFKNYQYMLPLIRGVVVHMQDHETIIHLPKNRYDDVMKVINNSNEHVMAIAANFSPEADSHLVCIQNDHGVYQTQAINRQNKPRKVTGASFMVLNGALKSNSGLTAKSSIVEDGLMVQIRPDMMAALRDTLRNMADFTIPCGAVDVPHPDETVILRWVDDDTSFNSGVKSPVDNRPLEGIESIRIQNTTDFQGHNKIIRWTEVFFIENGGSGDSVSKRHIPEPVDLSRLAENLAIAFCLALSESLQDLITLGLNKLGLRVTVDLEKVGYEVGSRGNPLPDQYMNNLDDLLIPVLHNAVSQQEGGPVVLELIFYILD